MYEIPKGTTVIQRDGSIKFYCSSKCRKNVVLGRDPLKTTWVRKRKKGENLGEVQEKIEKVEVEKEEKKKK